MKYRVSELVKFRYSDIGEYIDENHTNRPLRNDILVDLLNNQDKRIKELEDEKNELEICLKQDNEELKKEIKYLQSELYNIRNKTLEEVKLEIEKLER